METRLDIEEQIKVAMAAACDDMLNFTDEPSKEFNAEYLFTVCAAKAINSLNGPPGDPFKIYIERSTKKFASDCLKPVVFGNRLRNRPTIFRKGVPKIERSGRIDIAIYHDDGVNSGYLGWQPLCAIELKGFNPKRTLVVADLKRNLEFFRVSGPTGGSVLSFTLFAALHSFKKREREEQLQSDADSIERMYKNWISEVGNTNDICCHVQAFTVSKELVGRVVDEGQYIALDTDARHHFVGVIVSFLPKKSNSQLSNNSPSTD